MLVGSTGMDPQVLQVVVTEKSAIAVPPPFPELLIPSIATRHNVRPPVALRRVFSYVRFSFAAE